MAEQTNYTPPAGYSFLTPLYDIGVRLTTREAKWRRALVGLITPDDDDVLLDVGAGTGSLSLLIAPAMRRSPIWGSIRTAMLSRSLARKRGARA